MILASVIAVFVETVVWRVMMPDEPNPRYGSVAGVVSALGSLFIFAASMGLVGVSAGRLVGALNEFLILIYPIAVLGGLITGPIIVPLGVLVGYGYERHIQKGQQ